MRIRKTEDHMPEIQAPQCNGLCLPCIPLSELRRALDGVSQSCQESTQISDPARCSQDSGVLVRTITVLHNDKVK